MSLIGLALSYIILLSSMKSSNVTSGSFRRYGQTLLSVASMHSRRLYFSAVLLT